MCQSGTGAVILELKNAGQFLILRYDWYDTLPNGYHVTPEINVEVLFNMK